MSLGSSRNVFDDAGNNMENPPPVLLLFKSHPDDTAFSSSRFYRSELPAVADEGVKSILHCNFLRNSCRFDGTAGSRVPFTTDPQSPNAVVNLMLPSFLVLFLLPKHIFLYSPLLQSTLTESFKLNPQKQKKRKKKENRNTTDVLPI